MPNMTAVGGNRLIISNAILKIAQLVDEIIKKIPVAILNTQSGVPCKKSTSTSSPLKSF